MTGSDHASAPRRARSVGRYDLGPRIAAGGMASVHLGRARGAAGFERLVAIKRCHEHLRDSEGFVAMFLDEARLAARVRHPNVVATLDVIDGAAPCLVMEYVEGATVTELLRTAVRKGPRIPVEITVRVMVDALAGLHAAHELRDAAGTPLEVVHRDVSPQNVLVGTDGVARLVDFGIARAATRATVTRTGERKGKVPYMAPEQLAGDPVTRRTDVYAAGVVLWEMVAHRRLFDGATDAEIINRILRGAVPAFDALGVEAPAALEAAIRRAMATAPDERFATAAEFADAIERAGTPPAAPRAVAAFVGELLSGPLAERRALVASFERGEWLDEDDAPTHDATRTDVDGAPSATTVTGAVVLASPGTPAPSRPRWAAAAAALFVATAAAVALFHPRAHAPSSSRPAVSRPAAPPLSPAPSPAPVAPSAPSPLAPSAPSPLPPAATAAPVAAVPTPLRPHTHRASRARHSTGHGQPWWFRGP